MEDAYDFKWLVNDIDNSLIFILRSGKELIGTYQVCDVLSNGFESVSVKFANINDLTKFVNYGIVRFVDFKRENSIVDIPIRKLGYLYAHGNLIGEEYLGGIDLNELDAFSVLDGEVLGKGYAVYVYRINEATDELNEIMRIASSFESLPPNDKLQALERVNAINMERDKKRTDKKRG